MVVHMYSLLICFSVIDIKKTYDQYYTCRCFVIYRKPEVEFNLADQ